jgi:hypothetical protein
MIRNVHHGFGFRIRIPDPYLDFFYPSRISDPGDKKARIPDLDLLVPINKPRSDLSSFKKAKLFYLLSSRRGEEGGGANPP